MHVPSLARERASIRMRNEACGLFSSRSRKKKWGFPEQCEICSMTLLTNASCPHLKLDSSMGTRFLYAEEFFRLHCN